METRLKLYRMFHGIHVNSNLLLIVVGAVFVFGICLLQPKEYKKLKNKYCEYIKKTSLETDSFGWIRFLACYVIYGVNVQEYYVYGFSQKTDEERREYITEISRFEIYPVFNGSNNVELFANKYSTYKKYKAYYGRRIIEIRESSRNDIEEFIKSHSIMTIKPEWAAYGNGVEILSKENYPTDDLIEYVIQKKGYILEEYILQDDFFAKYHPQSVNTVRIPAFLLNDKVIIHRPFIKMGVGDSVVDNGGAGGFFVQIDAETGITCSHGVNEYGDEFTTHPDSGVELKNVQIPYWSQLVSLTKELMSLDRNMGYIGWDFALTPEGWIVVEGNDNGEFVGQQMPVHKGCAKEVNEFVRIKMNPEY